MHLVFETICMTVNRKTCQPMRCIDAESAAEPAQIPKRLLACLHEGKKLYCLVSAHQVSAYTQCKVASLCNPYSNIGEAPNDNVLSSDVCKSLCCRNTQPLTVRQLAGAAVWHVGEHLFDSGPRAGT